MIRRNSCLFATAMPDRDPIVLDATVLHRPANGMSRQGQPSLRTYCTYTSRSSSNGARLIQL
eukprot:6346883-Lingulodinium_polyedra.AAC.1